MPTAPPTICQLCHRVGCACKQQARAERDKYRGSSTMRGYDYRWQQFRTRYLAEYPLCVDCITPDPLQYRHAFEDHGPGRVKPAQHIHHIKKLCDHPELKYEPTNLMPLCEECHNKRTAKGE